uniref:WD_REPEATS_REGION domain-containing protein n=1 Tax=Glossina austeni TaxID=7395 RepID=A0A1A9V7A3_GLOAU
MLISGSVDNTVKVWECLKKRCPVIVIAAIINRLNERFCYVQCVLMSSSTASLRAICAWKPHVVNARRYLNSVNQKACKMCHDKNLRRDLKIIQHLTWILKYCLTKAPSEL